MKATWLRTADLVELYVEDTEHGGGVRMQWPSPAWAQAWIDEVARCLADLDGGEVPQ